MPEGSNTSKASLYEFLESEIKIDESIGEAQYTVRALKKEKKDLRALIKAAGFDLEVFDDTRKMMAQSFEEREAKHRERMRNMAWVGMPLGTQAEMFSEEETAVPPEVQLSRVQDAGRTAGKMGRERSANPWPAGQLLHQTWDSAWLEGSEQAAQSTEPKRGPGRPKKDAAPRDSNKMPTAAQAGLRKGRGKKAEVEPVFASEPIPDAETAELDETISTPPPNGAADLDFDAVGSA